MSVKTMGPIIVSAIAGLAVGYGIHPLINNENEDNELADSIAAQNDSEANKNKLITQLQIELATAKTNLATVNSELVTLKEAQVMASVKKADSDREKMSEEAMAEQIETALEDRIEDDIEDQPEKDARKITYEKALLALENGDTAAAQQLFNKLLATASTPQERQAAKQGLVSVHRANYDYLIAQGDQTNAALWSLFEIHKLDPNDQLTAELTNLSQQTYLEAQNISNQGDALGAADRLTSLSYLSRTMGFELTDSAGQPVTKQNFQAELKELESNNSYEQSLQSRAQNNLYSGSDIEKAFVFWDYVRLANVKGPGSLQDPAFRDEFVQSTVEHLNHLNNMNQTGEINSRMDFIRYAYPGVAADPRLADF